MNKNFTSPIIFGLILFLAVVLLASSVACKSTPTPASSPTSTASPTSTPTASPTASVTPSPTPSPTPAPSAATLVITTATLPDGVTGTAYSQTLQATGGTGAHTWGISSGSLPMGLVLDAKAGTISGTPRYAATYFFTVLSIDSAGASGSRALFVTVNLSRALSAAMIITTNSLPSGLVGTSYSQTLLAVSGNGSVTWRVANGSLPPGLNLDAKSGTVSGTPTASGASSFFIEAADSSGSNAIQPFSLTITSSSATATPSPSAPATGLAITTSTLPAGAVGTNYSQALKASSGSSPYSWSLSRGSLPAGLFLDAQLGIIFGNPASAGTANLLVQVTDSAGATNTQSLSITVNAK